MKALGHPKLSLLVRKTVISREEVEKVIQVKDSVGRKEIGITKLLQNYKTFVYRWI